MKRLLLWLFIQFVATVSLPAQWLSPGPLSRVHTELEGTEHCTQCHNIGARITAEKCLTCHSKVALELQEQRGYHTLYRNQTCTECHKEHRGLEAALTVLDEKTFDHGKLGFALEGQHAQLKCQSCHPSPGTYSGSDKACLACHVDTEHGRLDNDCGKCHNSNRFKPSTFRHKDEEIGSSKRHPGVACLDCHIDNQFSGMDRQCTACHKDEHKGQLAQSCSDCHKDTLFTTLSFDHNRQSTFKLKQAHLQLTCKECHTAQIYDKASAHCSDCHSDAHKGEVTQDCATCHDQSNFTFATYRHEAATFRLGAVHSRIDCKSCHSTNAYKETPKTCELCHKDAHKDELSGKCETCHSTDSFEPPLYKHEKPNVPLTGAHTQQPCSSCHQGNLHRTDDGSCAECHYTEHKGELDQPCRECHTTAAFKPSTFKHKAETWQTKGKHSQVTCAQCHKTGSFKSLDEECRTCHTDVHKGELGETCTTCHDFNTWKQVRYDHNGSDYILKGRHLDLKCEECHTQGKFTGMPSHCYDCHEDPHQKRYGVECESCHDEENWSNLLFNHDQTGYSLQGQHEQLSCALCHPQDRVVGTPEYCYGCHRRDYEAAVEPNHRAAKFNIECEECHKNSDADWGFGYWEEHESLFARRTSSGGHHEPFTCSECHPTNTDYKKFNCLTCHERDEMDLAHRNMQKYRYQNSKCIKCHPNGEIEEILPEEE